MKIVDVHVRTFWHTTHLEKDTDGHDHPGPAKRIRKSILTLVAENGTEGYAFGSPEQLRPHLLDNFIKPVLLKQDAFARERLWQDLAHWQRGSGGQLRDRKSVV